MRLHDDLHSYMELLREKCTEETFSRCYITIRWKILILWPLHQNGENGCIIRYNSLKTSRLTDEGPVRVSSRFWRTGATIYVETGTLYRVN